MDKLNPNFLFPLLGLALGIFLNADFFSGYGFGLICIGVAIAIWLVITILSRNPAKGLSLSRFHSLWILFLFIGIGALNFNFRCFSYFKASQGKDFSFTGRIEEVSTLADGDRFIVNILNVTDTSGENIDFKNLKILLKTNGYVGHKGDEIIFSGSPKLLYSQRKNNSFVERMKHKGILYQMTINSDNIAKIRDPNIISQTLRSLNDKFTILLEKSSLNRSTINFLISILLGDRSFLTEETKTSLSSLGLAHVLALSGMHVAIILTILLFLFFPLSLMGHPKTRKVLAILFLWFFVILTGGAPSTIRAAIMATLIVGAFIMERKNAAFNGLLLAVFIILLIRPYTLWDPGLQLSFLCVASILLFVNHLNPIDHHSHPQLYKTVNLVLISIITTFCTWALMSYYFHSIPVMFLPANLIFLPLFPFYFGLGLLYLVLLLLGIDFQGLASLLDSTYNGFVKIAEVISFSGASNIAVEMPLISVCLWIIGILFMAIFLRAKNLNKRIFGILTSFCLIISIALPLIIKEKEIPSIRFINSRGNIEVSLSDGKRNNRYTFVRGSVSRLQSSDLHIISIDNHLKSGKLQELINVVEEEILYLLIGPGADMEQIAELINSNKIKMVILHNGIGENKKGELLSLLEEPLNNKIYSLRENGSLEVDL